MRGRGFTLIEMAVVIAILSLISVALLGVFSSVRTNTAIAKTRNNHDAIYQALVRFAANNGRLPCPAPFALAPTAANYGSEEPGVAGVCTDGAPDALPFPLPNNEYAVGNVPFRTLGLGPEQRYDGWNHQFTYVVAIAATGLDPAGLGASPFLLNRVPWLDATIPTTPINIFNNVDGTLPEPVNQPVTAGGEVAVVFSYGPNASGAWTVDGAQLDAPVGTALNELENLDANDVIFVDAEYSEDDVTPFDDLIRGYTEAQLMQPLIDAGATGGRVAEAGAQLRRIRDAVVGFMAAAPNASGGIDPDGAPQPVGCYCQAAPSDPVWCGANPGLCFPCGAAPNGCAQTIIRAVPFADTNGDGLADNNGTNAFVPTVDLGLPLADQLDPWGVAIIYQNGVNTVLGATSAFGAIAPGDGIWSGNVGAGNGLTLQSAGPDGFPDGGCPPVNDDICLVLSVQELIGILTASGLPVD